MLNHKTICFINTSRLWGGGENWQAETILDYKSKIRPVSVSNPRSQLFNKMNLENVETIPFVTGNLSFLNPFKIIKAYRLLKKLKPHAVMFNTTSDFKLFALPARWAKIPFILYRRDNGKPIKPHLLNKYLLQNCITHFLPCSQFIRDSALSKNATLIPTEKIKVINNSINLEKWDNDLSAPFTFPNPDKHIVFGCIGRLSHEKGQQMLISAANELYKTKTTFKVLIAGNGPTKNELAETIKKLQLEDVVQLLGFVESNKAFLEAIDCLIIPSYWEGLPTSAIEAMAAKKPVIAFDVAGNPEAVIDKSTGFLVTPFDIKELAQKMSDFIKHPEIGNQLGVNGRNLAEKSFSRAATDKQLNEFFL